MSDEYEDSDCDFGEHDWVFCDDALAGDSYYYCDTCGVEEEEA